MAGAVNTEADNTARRRRRLVDQIGQEATATASYTGTARFTPAVMAAMARVPRHRFVPPDQERAAYVNAPLPIGHGQTISQPFVVALMTELLGLREDETVLEVGTGSGYQTAVLCELVAHVYSMEIVPELARTAAHRLAVLGYANLEVRTGDGACGWPEHAPYDAIMVTAAPSEVPEALVSQLKAGGVMVAPIGAGRFSQDLIRIEKDASGKITRKPVLPVAFVPLTHGRGADP